MKENIKVTFAPGCFDNFEGTQEELDQLVAEIKNMAATGQLFSYCEPLDEEYLDDHPEIESSIYQSSTNKKVLQ